MSATNSTANYELPIFLATDKPAWLTDWNGAMSAIDTAIHTAQAAADGAQTTASAATADISTINASLTTITGNITSLTTSVNSNTGAINTINSLIGNGEPTTTDKTLIGAINEIYGMITGGGGDEIEAQNVSYDNTTSGLTADDVQSAIDEVINMIPSPGGAIDFQSGTTLTFTPATGFTINSATVKSAVTADGIYAKIYGGIDIDVTDVGATGSYTVGSLNTAFTGITTAFDMLIGFAILKYEYTTDSYTVGKEVKLHVNTNGSIDVVVDLSGITGITSGRAYISLPACIYQLIPLGD